MAVQNFRNARRLIPCCRSACATVECDCIPVS
jgi:hypothetical protein